jgi:ABC-type siderophore export system fused ATPase/permease subunit
MRRLNLDVDLLPFVSVPIHAFLLASGLLLFGRAFWKSPSRWLALVGVIIVAVFSVLQFYQTQKVYRELRPVVTGDPVKTRLLNRVVTRYTQGASLSFLIIMVVIICQTYHPR